MKIYFTYLKSLKQFLPRLVVYDISLFSLDKMIILIKRSNISKKKHVLKQKQALEEYSFGLSNALTGIFKTFPQ